MSAEQTKTSKPEFTIGQAIDQITAALTPFDGDVQQTILATVFAHLKISAPGSVSPNFAQQLAPVQHANAPPPQAGGEPPMDIRMLASEKQPKSAKDMACLVGYYLAELAPDAERKPTITSDDIEKYFKQARFKLPEKVEQVLPDAKKTGHFDSVARGEYELTRIGQNHVTHGMPSKRA